jgi:hypothetical protein
MQNGFDGFLGIGRGQVTEYLPLRRRRWAGRTTSLGSSKTLLRSQLSGLKRIWTLEWVLDTKQTSVAALDKLISIGEREEHCILRVRRDYG